MFTLYFNFPVHIKPINTRLSVQCFIKGELLPCHSDETFQLLPCQHYNTRSVANNTGSISVELRSPGFFNSLTLQHSSQPPLVFITYQGLDPLILSRIAFKNPKVLVFRILIHCLNLISVCHDHVISSFNLSLLHCQKIAYMYSELYPVCNET